MTLKIKVKQGKNIKIGTYKNLQRKQNSFYVIMNYLSEKVYTNIYI